MKVDIKLISIVATVLAVLIAVMLLMQKGNYESQARTFYEETTNKSMKGSKAMISNVNATLEQNRLLWSLVSEVAEKKLSTAKQLADAESKYFPIVKGSNSIAKQTRTFAPNPDFPIVFSFAKVETDKKTGVKTLVDLNAVSIDALLGLGVSNAEEADVSAETEE